MSAAAVLLAAGAGTRYDDATPKLLAHLGGKPLIRWAIESVLAAGLPGPYVVTGAVDLGDALHGATAVHNDHWSDGMASSLRAGIRAAESHGHDAVVVALGDQPGISPEAWRAVAASAVTPIAVATYGGRRAHPVRLDASAWTDLPSEGEEGARALMREQPELVTEVPCTSGNASDIDTAEELHRFDSPTRSA